MTRACARRRHARHHRQRTAARTDRHRHESATGPFADELRRGIPLGHYTAASPVIAGFVS